MTFTINRPQDIHTALSKASSAITSGGGFFSGNEQSGRFSGHGIEGGYIASGQIITVTINKKPFVLPAQTVEKYVQEFFKSA